MRLANLPLLESFVGRDLEKEPWARPPPANLRGASGKGADRKQIRPSFDSYTHCGMHVLVYRREKGGNKYEKEKESGYFVAAFFYLRGFSSFLS